MNWHKFMLVTGSSLIGSHSIVNPERASFDVQ
jgi:hypothetical protein